MDQFTEEFIGFHVRMNSIIEGIVVAIFDGAPWDYPIYP